MVALVCRNNKSTRYAAPLQSLKHQFQLYLAEISKDSLIREELGADSLDLVTLVWALEEEFGGKIEESEIMELTTPQKIADYIIGRIKESTPNEA